MLPQFTCIRISESSCFLGPSCGYMFVSCHLFHPPQCRIRPLTNTTSQYSLFLFFIAFLYLPLIFASYSCTCRSSALLWILMSHSSFLPSPVSRQCPGQHKYAVNICKGSTRSLIWNLAFVLTQGKDVCVGTARQAYVANSNSYAAGCGVSTTVYPQLIKVSGPSRETSDRKQRRGKC